MLDVYVRALAIDPVTPTTLYAGTFYGGIFKSTNGGGNWNPVNTGIPNTHVAVLAIDPVTPTTLYAGTNGGPETTTGVFKSTSGGGNWSPVNNGLPDGGILALAIDPTDPNTLYAGRALGGLFKSTNGGEEWSASYTGLSGLAVESLAIDPTRSTALYAGTYEGGVSKSTNSGENWETFNDGLTVFRIHALAIATTTSTVIYAGTEGGVASINESVTTSTFHSQGFNDEHIFELIENSNTGWRTNTTSARFYVGDDQRNRQYRAILSFDTSSLPDDTIILSATLNVKRTRTIGTNPFDTHGALLVEIGSPCFGSSCNLEASDFQASAQEVAGLLGSFSVDNWHSAVIGSNVYPYIDLAGTTQFRLRFELEDNNDRVWMLFNS